MSNDNEFDDPLEDYDPPQYDDALEEAIGERKVLEIQHEPMTCVPSTATIQEALQMLRQQEVACAMVTEEDRLIGVFSDRDLLKNVALEFNDMKDRPITEVMTADPVFVYEDDTTAAALHVMAVSGYRHVPIVDHEERVVGIVSPDRVLSFLETYFPEE